MTPALITIVAVGSAGLALIWLAQTVTLWAIGDPRPVTRS